MKTACQTAIAVVVTFAMSIPAPAGCNCNGGASAGYSAIMPVTPYYGLGSVAAYGRHSAFWAHHNGYAPAIHAPHPAQADGRRYPIHPFGGDPTVGASLIPHVPGTLGETYTRTSHRIPEDKHPRLAMLAIRDNHVLAHVSVQKMNGFRMESGVWLFETDKPLVSWTENIVRIEAREDAADVEPHAVRFVRLIPGRLVYLDFHRPPEEAETETLPPMP
ncbi:MAG: hypothetical protein GY903_20800 [Fuerstiella sp.]|nr:hypothetical protein [Fuerstiella sp.]MCP4856929.1 hypothetical protein [Fuerstiella sp.]